MDEGSERVVKRWPPLNAKKGTGGILVIRVCPFGEIDRGTLGRSSRFAWCLLPLTCPAFPFRSLSRLKRQIRPRDSDS